MFPFTVSSQWLSHGCWEVSQAWLLVSVMTSGPWAITINVQLLLRTPGGRTAVLSVWSNMDRVVISTPLPPSPLGWPRGWGGGTDLYMQVSAPQLNSPNTGQMQDKHGVVWTSGRSYMPVWRYTCHSPSAWPRLWMGLICSHITHSIDRTWLGAARYCRWQSGIHIVETCIYSRRSWSLEFG